MSTSRLFLVTLMLSAPGPLARAGDDVAWGSFRGPNGSGISSSESVPPSLDPEQTLTWQTSCLPGYSSPVLSEDYVFVTGHEEKRMFAFCLDRWTGEQVWKVEAPAADDSPYKGPNSPVSSTPVTDGETLFVLYPSFGVVAYAMDGSERWQHQTEDFKVPHVMSTSPILVDDKVVVQCDQDVDSFLLALDKGTGKQSWKTSRPGVTHGYSSPAVYRPEDGPAHIVVSGSFQTVAYSADTGKKVWWVDGMSWQGSTLPVIENGVLFVHSFVPPLTEFGAPPISGSFEAALEEKDADGNGLLSRDEWPDERFQQLWFLYDLNNDDMLGEEDWNEAIRRSEAKGGLFAVRLGAEGNLSEEHVLWTYSDRRGMPGYASPLAHGGALYLIRDGVATLLSQEDGSVLSQNRFGEPDSYYASPVVAAGRMVMAGLSGQLAVIDMEGFETLSVNHLQQEIWATPALADGQVIVRTEEGLYCFEG